MRNITDLLGNTDIYLIDQIMKGRYQPPATVLDAGAGGGRNLHWFMQQNFTVFATDRAPEAMEALMERYPNLPKNCCQVAPVEALPFPDAFFHHIISSAVLHFAENEHHFSAMFGEMIRVLRPDGTLFIRVATDIGVENTITPLGNGRYHLADGSDRFLLTRTLLDRLVLEHHLTFAEPFKTVLVESVRSMAVIVLSK